MKDHNLLEEYEFKVAGVLSLLLTFSPYWQVPRESWEDYPVNAHDREKEMRRDLEHLHAINKTTINQTISYKAQTVMTFGTKTIVVFTY